MDIIKSRAESRTNKISQIAATIKKVFSAGMDIDKENLIREACSQTGISRRTILEYLDIALVNFNTEEIKVDDRVMIINKNSKIKNEI